MANDLLVIDIKASGLCDQSYPISIGIAGADNQLWSWLVYPLETWSAWDVALESQHGITRNQLLEQGRDSFIICREMNTVFRGHALISLSSRTRDLLEKMFRDLGIRMAFEVVDMDILTGNGMVDPAHDDFGNPKLSNVASIDAAIIRDMVVTYRTAIV